MQRENRLGLHGNEEKDLQYRQPPARVSSLRSKPSELKTPRISSRDVHGASSGRQTDRTIRPSVLEKKAEAVSSSPSPLLSPPLGPGSDSKISKKVESADSSDESDESSPSPTVNAGRRQIKNSHLNSNTPLGESADSSSQPPPQSHSQKETRPRSKPPVAPKPRISFSEQAFGRRSDSPNHPEKPTTPPNSPSAIRRLVAPTELPPPPPVKERCIRPKSPTSRQPDVPGSPAPPAADHITPPNAPTAAPITKEDKT